MERPKANTARSSAFQSSVGVTGAPSVPRSTFTRLRAWWRSFRARPLDAEEAQTRTQARAFAVVAILCPYRVEGCSGNGHGDPRVGKDARDPGPAGPIVSFDGRGCETVVKGGPRQQVGPDSAGPLIVHEPFHRSWEVGLRFSGLVGERLSKNGPPRPSLSLGSMQHLRLEGQLHQDVLHLFMISHRRGHRIEHPPGASLTSGSPSHGRYVSPWASDLVEASWSPGTAPLLLRVSKGGSSSDRSETSFLFEREGLRVRNRAEAIPGRESDTHRARCDVRDTWEAR
eukprot:scaffold1401_cov330-Pavlova_lutheri.AAC.14